MSSEGAVNLSASFLLLAGQRILVVVPCEGCGVALLVSEGTACVDYPHADGKCGGTGFNRSGFEARDVMQTTTSVPESFAQH